MIRRRDTYHCLAIVGIGETDSNRLIDEEDVRVGVPRFRMEFRSISVQNSARTELHEEPKGRRTSRTFAGLASRSALLKNRTNLHSSKKLHRLCPGCSCFRRSRRICGELQCLYNLCKTWKQVMYRLLPVGNCKYACAHFTVLSQNEDFFILTLYRGNAGCPRVVNSFSARIDKSSAGLNRSWS